ncbi:MAG: ribosome-binding factor A [bacterium]|nr:ribosome-binding factor A [bacterium]
MEKRDERIKEVVRKAAALFLNKESNGSSLITVTDVALKNRGKKADIMITVLPENQEDAALDFSKRKRGEFREVLKHETSLQVLPFVDFLIDKGEKNRQRVDELLSGKI